MYEVNDDTVGRLVWLLWALLSSYSTETLWVLDNAECNVLAIAKHLLTIYDLLISIIRPLRRDSWRLLGLCTGTNIIIVSITIVITLDFVPQTDRQTDGNAISISECLRNAR